VLRGAQGRNTRPRDEAAAESDDMLVEYATAPGGKRWRLTYELPRAEREWSLLDAFDPPDDLLIMGTVGGLFFSAALAFYLTRPVQRIRKGFELLAAGNLATRLQPSIGRRRDEIADLARDFDGMAERLQQLVLVRDQLLHDVSHELRSPLARLNQAIALLRQDPANAEMSLMRIETEIRRLDDLVGELLSLARAESGEAGDHYFDLPQLIDSVAANAAFEAGTRNVSVEVHAAVTEARIVRGHAELMRRALENVIRNALHVSAPGQKVEISLWIEAAHFVVTVADAGPGVASGKLAAMFDPFVRLQNASPGKGYGLGLAIARRALLTLGGSIEARNRTPQGLLVTMQLPVHPFTVPA